MPIEMVSPARLSRATVARQMLLDREQLSAPETVQRLCALQAREPKRPYLGAGGAGSPFSPSAICTTTRCPSALRSQQ
jgi:hypothetical protein